MRVCVIGAGFAGLAAATELAEAGIDVVVLEARDRPGGRVWSQPLDGPGGSGPVVERGGEFVLEGYDTLRAYAGRLGLDLVDTGMSYYVREPRGVDGVDAAAMSDAGRLLGTAAATAASAESVRDLVARLGVAGPLAEAVTARVEISCGHDADRLAARVLDHVASLEPLPSHRIAGGNQQLALRLADALGSRVRYGAAVRAVDWAEREVRVRTGSDEVAADRAVLALPLPVLRELPITPPPPERQLAAWREALVGEAAKLHVGLEREPATSAVMSVPGRFWCWTATDGARAVAPVLACFAGSPAGLARLGLDGGPDVWLDRVRELRPELAPAFRGALLTTWSDDPWSRGAYLAQAVGVRAGADEAMARPVGPLHFAGEHTAGEWSALMEGALRSGRRAAEEIAVGRAAGGVVDRSARAATR